MNKCEVYFCLRGKDFDPSIATRTIDLEGAITRLKGDPLPKFSSWRFSSGEQTREFVGVYEMAAKVVYKLETHKAQIAELRRSQNLEAILQIVLTISTDDTLSTPAIGFDRYVLDFLSATGATIDIDTYLD